MKTQDIKAATGMAFALLALSLAMPAITPDQDEAPLPPSLPSQSQVPQEAETSEERLAEASH